MLISQAYGKRDISVIMFSLHLLACHVLEVQGNIGAIVRDNTPIKTYDIPL